MEEFKRIPGTFFNKLKLTFVILGGIILSISCAKLDTDYSKYENKSHTVFVNAVPNNLSFLFYLDNFEITGQAIAFSYSLPAIYVTPGMKQIDLVLRNTRQSILTDTIIFKLPNFYTVFATGKITPEFVVIEDKPSDLANPPAGKAKARLINVSSDAPNIDLLIEGGATLFTNVAYKDHTEFINLDPGIYKFSFRETGTNTIKYTKRVVIDPDRIYDVFSLGAWDTQNGDAPLDLGLLDAVSL